MPIATRQPPNFRNADGYSSAISSLPPQRLPPGSSRADCFRAQGRLKRVVTRERSFERSFSRVTPISQMTSARTWDKGNGVSPHYVTKDPFTGSSFEAMGPVR